MNEPPVDEATHALSVAVLESAKDIDKLTESQRGIVDTVGFIGSQMLHLASLTMNDPVELAAFMDQFADGIRKLTADQNRRSAELEKRWDRFWDEDE